LFLKVISCEVAFREVCACAARSVNQLDLEFLTQGYHDNPTIGVQRLQERIDAVPEGGFDEILLGYGLCNHMLTGLRAPSHTGLIVARAHDCITFFLGSKECYQDFFIEHPGTYYFTAGWLEHRQRGGERLERKQGAGIGEVRDFDEMVAEYGEENARYLAEFMGSWTNNYKRGVFINFDFTDDLPSKDEARRLCEERGWEFEEVPGDLGLLQRWLDGEWQGDDFLTVPPGQIIQPSYGDDIIQLEPIAEPAPGGRS
jgi:hypothetical protein